MSLPLLTVFHGPPAPSGQSQVLSIWHSRFHPLCPTRLSLQGLKPCHGPPKFQEPSLRFRPHPLPLQEPSCCCRECPSPSLAWHRFSRGVRGWCRAQKLFPGRGGGGRGQVLLPLAPSLPSPALPWGPSLTFLGWLWSTLPGSSHCLTHASPAPVRQPAKERHPSPFFTDGGS